jgi:hypothetical protein
MLATSKIFSLNVIRGVVIRVKYGGLIFSCCPACCSDSKKEKKKSRVLTSNQLREPFPIPQSFPIQNLAKLGALCWRKCKFVEKSTNFEVENFEV